MVRAKLDEYAPLKTSVFKGNNKPHTKRTQKAIIVRTRLINR